MVLNYIGGKARVAQKIADAIPKDTSVLVSPFFGGGSVEFLCASRGMTVIAYDIFRELVQFWQTVKTSRLELADEVEAILPMTKERYHLCRTSIDNARDFFIVNKCCYNGIMNGSYSHQLGRRFSSAPERLRKFVYPYNISVQCQPFSQTLAQHSEAFIFADPPYYEVGRT